MVGSSGPDLQPHKVTFDSNSEVGPSFGADGRKLFFQRIEGGAANTPTSVQLYSVVLERLEKDPDDPEERAEAEAPRGEGGEGEGTPGAGGRDVVQQRSDARAKIKVDWAGMKRRTRQITRMPFAVTNYTVAPDSRTIVFVTSEPAGPATVPVVYSIQDDGRRLSRLTSGLPPTEDGEGGGGGFGGGISELNIARDGRTLFFRERDGVYSIALPAGGAASAMGAARTGAGADSARRKLAFNVRVRVDRPAEWAEMFDDGWRTMKYR